MYNKFGGIYTINPGGWSDIFENLSGNPSCDIDPATCRIWEYKVSKCTKAYTGSYLKILKDVITVNTDMVPPKYEDPNFCVTCKNYAGTTINEGTGKYRRFSITADWCKPPDGIMYLVDPSPSLTIDYDSSVAS
jgi:hypothetical protein